MRPVIHKRKRDVVGGEGRVGGLRLFSGQIVGQSRGGAEGEKGRGSSREGGRLGNLAMFRPGGGFL